MSVWSTPPLPLSLPRIGEQERGLSVQEMLRRKPTRIELKPDDRDEYFDHKNKTKPDSSNKDDKYSKDVRIGLKTPR